MVKDNKKSGKEKFTGSESKQEYFKRDKKHYKSYKKGYKRKYKKS
jgi:hypothetical protein